MGWVSQTPNSWDGSELMDSFGREKMVLTTFFQTRRNMPSCILFKPVSQHKTSNFYVTLEGLYIFFR